MKNYSLIFLGSLCASFLFLSCSADNDYTEQTTALNSNASLTTSTAEITSADLVGTWKIQTYGF